jgi:subtilisin family serine protease
MQKVEILAKFFGDCDKISDEIGCKSEILCNNFAIFSTSLGQIGKIKNHPQILYSELSHKVFHEFTENTSNLNAVCKENLNNSPENLTGKGVIIAILDSGIDFRHPDFIDENNNSRILYIWDQNKPGTPPDNFDFGTEYSNSQINMAINNELELPFIDLDGHGTAVAGIAAGNGRASSGRNTGIAPQSSIIAVKLLSSGDYFATSTANLARAVKYVLSKQEKLQMPVVINISYGTNQGAHDGQSVFEQYLDNISENKNISIVVATGNEGSARHHFRAQIKTGDILNIEFIIKTHFDEFNLVFINSFYDLIDFQIISSSGEQSPIINLNQVGAQTVFFNNIKISFYLEQPTPNYEGQQVIINFSATGSYLPKNSWFLKIIAKNIIDGRIDAWLPITESSGLETQFLNPKPQTSLTIPSTALKVISVGGYDSNIDEFAEFSGRGYTRTNLIKPDLVAPAVSIISAKSGGTYSTFTGTSFAAPFVTGACALMMQWGIINKNDIFMYGQRLKAFLKLGTNKKSNINYPNDSWGYGSLCINSALNFSKKYNLIKNNQDLFPKEFAQFQIQDNSENFENIKNIENENINIENKNIEESSQNFDFIKEPVIDENYMDFIMRYDRPSLDFIEKEPRIKISSVLQQKYAIIHAPADVYEYYRKNLQDYVLAEKAMICGLAQNYSAISAAGITAVREQQFLQLTGQGVLVGIIDTGIDIYNNCFKYENGKSKISYLWDQESQNGTPPDGFLYGTEYNNNEINNLISQNLDDNININFDENGHGTFISSVIAGRKTENSSFLGIAPDSNIIFVKLKKAKKIMKDNSAIFKDISCYESTDIMTGVEYILNTARNLQKPVVINIPMQTNEGAHDGLSYFEKYLSQIAEKTGVSIIIPSGNQANKAGHLQIEIAQDENYKVEFNVANQEPGFLINLWTSVPDRVSVSLTTPLGNKIERKQFTINEFQEYNFVLEKTKIQIQYIFPDIKNGNQNIIIKLIDPTPGLWTLNIFGDLSIYGVVDIWMPISDFISQGTAFLNATVDGTVTIPSTSINVICVGAYDNIDGSIYLSSGRGQKNYCKIEPDFVAPGVDILGIYPRNLLGEMTGTGAASAIVAGAAALLLEWAIVKENDVKINNIRLRSYLILGCEQNPNIEYPNDLWGYGKINLINTFRNIR